MQAIYLLYFMLTSNNNNHSTLGIRASYFQWRFSVCLIKFDALNMRFTLFLENIVHTVLILDL